MSLAQKLIDDLNAECAERLAAIEAAAGRIEEAETLASTLRHHGIDALTHGFTSHRIGLTVWVQAFPNSPAALRQALADADLRIEVIGRGEHHREIRLQGLDTELTVTAEIAAALQSSEEPAHA